jgi:hypothetical protein
MLMNSIGVQPRTQLLIQIQYVTMKTSADRIEIFIILGGFVFERFGDTFVCRKFKSTA